MTLVQCVTALTCPEREALCFPFPAVVARSTLAPFDCIAHHGGVWTMEAEPSIVCGAPGGPHARMRVVAIATMIMFVLGLPIAYAAFLWRNRREIEVDQELRQRGEGYGALTNPHNQV